MSEIVKDGAKAVYTCGGDITATTKEEIRKMLKDLLADGVTTLTFDIAATKMVDSVGIGLLIAAHNSLNKAGGALTVVNASPDLMDLFKNMRLTQHFTITAA